jgi:RNA polymerase sigma factor (sigma-70 family)
MELESALYQTAHDISPEDATDIKLMRQYIFSLLDLLDSDEKQIIQLFYFDGLHWKTIAEIMDDTVENLKERKCRILKKLRRMMNIE